MLDGTWRLDLTGDPRSSALRAISGGMTLTIGAGVKVRGGSSSVDDIGRASSRERVGVAEVSLAKQGNISVDVSGTALRIAGQGFGNVGVAQARDGGSVVTSV